MKNKHYIISQKELKIEDIKKIIDLDYKIKLSSSVEKNKFSGWYMSTGD